MIKDTAISAVCVMTFLAGVTASRLPGTPETVEEPRSLPRHPLDTTIPVLVGASKAGYCEVKARVAFAISDPALAESKLYDVLMHEAAKEAEQEKALCVSLESFSTDEITVTKTRYTPLK